MKTKTYTVNKLRNKIKSNTEINEQYFKKEITSFSGHTKDNYKTLYKDEIKEYTAFNTQPKDPEKEKWEKYSDIIPDLQISNLGRVRYKVANLDQVEEFKILDQVEEFKNDEHKTHIGYLQLDKKQAEDLKIWKKIKENYVYQLVAKVWLENPNDFGNEIYEIHHIDNDGYNNAVSNLIWVKKCQHGHIHSKNISECVSEKCGNCTCIQKVKYM